MKMKMTLFCLLLLVDHSKIMVYKAKIKFFSALKLNQVPVSV